MVDLGLLKSGKVELQSTIERSNGETCVISESSIYLLHESHKRI